jgi:hypothetical protein
MAEAGNYPASTAARSKRDSAAARLVLDRAGIQRAPLTTRSGRCGNNKFLPLPSAVFALNARPLGLFTFWSLP